MAHGAALGQLPEHGQIIRIRGKPHAAPCQMEGQALHPFRAFRQHGKGKTAKCPFFVGHQAPNAAGRFPWIEEYGGCRNDGVHLEVRVNFSEGFHKPISFFADVYGIRFSLQCAKQRRRCACKRPFCLLYHVPLRLGNAAFSWAAAWRDGQTIYPGETNF